MSNNVSLWRCIFRLDLRRLLIAALATASLGASIAPSAGQSLVMQEPDFSGLFRVDEIFSAPVLRDSVRGWTYFAVSGGGGNVEGVAFSQWLFRISDAGIPDVRWRLPSDFQITEQYLAPDGTPIVHAYVKKSPTFEERWYRLERESVGEVVPVEIPNSAQLPPRDSINLLQSAALVPRLLPQGDGTTIAFETTMAPAPSYALTYTLRKLDARNNVQWSAVVNTRPRNLATDARGNIYLLGKAVSIRGKTANLIRLSTDGYVDATWNPSIEIDSNVSSTVRVVNDRIVIADFISGGPPVYRLTTFDLVNGGKLTERFPQYALGGITDDGAVLSAHGDGHWALLDARRSDAGGDSVSSARVGISAWLTAAVRWQDGYVLGGNFLYWFNGKLYRNLMRVDAAFRPDPTWTPPIDGTVAALAVDTQGRLIVGSNSASGREGRLTRFSADGAMDVNWHSVITGDVYKLYSTSDGMLFVGGAFSAIDGVQRQSLARFSADGLLDRDWASKPSWPAMEAVRTGQFGRDGIYQMLDAGTDGVYFVWEDGFMNGASAGSVRLSREGVGAELSVPRGLRAGGSMMRDATTGVIYATADAWELTSGRDRGTALIRLLPPDMTVDPAWTTFAGEHGRHFYGFAYQTDAHVYVCRDGVTTEVRRFDKLTGREDPDWRSDEIYLCDAAFERSTDGSTTVFSGPLTRYSSTACNEPHTVVEYYGRTAKRFFITGRATEIALLDGLSASFSRTGMQFSAETATERTSDTTRTPICRFYAPPEAGGSNTHFYGRDSDCTMLKRLPTLRYEGYDFRAGLPDSVGACPLASPQPVYRLFNQATANNSGNHRYVVSEVRKNEMIAAGWVSEGVAFCTTSATDSRSLAEITQ